MRELEAKHIRKQPRFNGLDAFEEILPLSGAVWHGEEVDAVGQILAKGGTGEAVTDLEKTIAEYAGVENICIASCGEACGRTTVREQHGHYDACWSWKRRGTVREAGFLSGICVGGSCFPGFI